MTAIKAQSALSAPVLAGALLAAAVVMFAPQVLNDGDTYWHLAAGQWMLAHGQILKTDVFSYTRAGAAWDAHEWLAEDLMALAFRLAGWSGLLVLCALAAAATAWLMISWLQKRLQGLTLAVVLVLAASCMAPSLLARPHLLALPILAGWTVAMLRAREAARAPHPALAAVMIVWANMHGGYVFGFVLLAGLGLEAILGAGEGRLGVARDWGVIGLLSLIAALITPQGVFGLIYPFQIMEMGTLNAITEWRPTSFAVVTPFEITLLVTLFVCLGRGVRITTIRLLLLLFLLHMALQHARHQIVLAVVAPLILAAPLASALGQMSRPAERDRRLWPIAAAMACALVVLRISLPAERTDGGTSPVTALRHVPATLAAQPVLNDYGFGGYLIFKGVRPFIDGRADMYGDRYFAAYVRATEPDPQALTAMLAAYKISWTLFATSDPVVEAMDREPGWRRLYADRFAVVHVRDDAALQVQAAVTPPVLRP